MISLPKISIEKFCLLIVMCSTIIFLTINYLQLYSLNEDMKDLISSNTMDDMFDYNLVNDTAGRYFIYNKNIAIYTKGMSPYQTMETAIHEIGHYVWYEYLSDNLREKYKIIYVNSDDFVTSYAKSDVEEDFAETFMTGISCTFDSSILPEDRRVFFENYVENYIN